MLRLMGMHGGLYCAFWVPMREADAVPTDYAQKPLLSILCRYCCADWVGPEAAAAHTVHGVLRRGEVEVVYLLCSITPPIARQIEIIQ
jgi:hypothetical protein